MNFFWEIDPSWVSKLKWTLAVFMLFYAISWFMDSNEYAKYIGTIELFGFALACLWAKKLIRGYIFWGAIGVTCILEAAVFFVYDAPADILNLLIGVGLLCGAYDDYEDYAEIGVKIDE